MASCSWVWRPLLFFSPLCKMVRALLPIANHSFPENTAESRPLLRGAQPTVTSDQRGFCCCVNCAILKPLCPGLIFLKAMGCGLWDWTAHHYFISVTQKPPPEVLMKCCPFCRWTHGVQARGIQNWALCHSLLLPPPSCGVVSSASLWEGSSWCRSMSRLFSCEGRPSLPSSLFLGSCSWGWHSCCGARTGGWRGCFGDPGCPDNSCSGFSSFVSAIREEKWTSST